MPLRVVQDLPQTPERGGQLTIAVSGRNYSMWHDLEQPVLDGMDDIARNAVLQAWWEYPSRWYRVGADACTKCGHYRPLCALCLDDVSVFPDAEWMKHTIYLCAQCGDFSEDVEVGAYACCEGCVCDT